VSETQVQKVTPEPISTININIKVYKKNGFYWADVNIDDVIKWTFGPEDISICTPKALFEFDNSIGELVLVGLLPGSTIDDVINNMGFRPRIREPVTILEPVTEDKVRLLNKWDPNNVRSR